MTKPRCLCLDLPIIPLQPRALFRPRKDCPIHKIIAERWDDIHSWQEYDAAMLADKNRLLQTVCEKRAR